MAFNFFLSEVYQCAVFRFNGQVFFTVSLPSVTDICLSVFLNLSFFGDFQIIFILFCVIRRLVWDYGRLALIQKQDQG